MAVFYLEATKRISGLVPDPDDDANRFWVIANVFELAVQHRHLPIGHCDNEWLKPRRLVIDSIIEEPSFPPQVRSYRKPSLAIPIGLSS